jgi:hypothetical protein
MRQSNFSFENDIHDFHGHQSLFLQEFAESIDPLLGAYQIIECPQCHCLSSQRGPPIPGLYYSNYSDMYLPHHIMTMALIEVDALAGGSD